MTSIKMSDKVLPVFHDFWKASNDSRILHKVLKGGRNSSKSTHIAIRLIYDVMKYPLNALCVRKVAATIAESIHEQLMWTISYLNVEKFFKEKKSPLGLIYLPRGNGIIYRGADNPIKIKSIKKSKFPIARLWIEEEAEFKTEDEVQTIIDSIVRAELDVDLFYSIFHSYNPPKRKQHWLNKKYNTQFVPKNTFVHHSDYRDNPFLSQAALNDIEHTRLTNPQKYKWNYLGEPTGGGVVPFENLVFRKITDDEVRTFDNIRQGLDWGYAADPVAFGRMHYDKTRRKLYIFDEIYGVKMSNRELVERVKEKKYHTTLTIADSAEPKSIDECKDMGMYITRAKKGPGSVEYGEKWLDDLEEVIIDPERTPNTAREFEAIDYQIDKDGNIKNKLEDKDNHSIDMTRYAMENDMDRSDAIIFA